MCWSHSEARSALLVYCRFIRYQSGLPLVSRGFSAASGMRTKCPPELQSGSGRVLEIHTPTRDTLTLTWGGLMSSQGGSLHHSQQCSAPSTRSCALYLGSITVRRACLKLVAKTRRQLRKGSAKGDVTCSTELTRHVRWSHSETDSPLLVCSRFIRYQSGLPLVPRGCSAGFSVWTKCPPDWASGSDRLLDIHTPTCQKLSLARGRLDVKSRHPLHHSQQCSTPTTCFCTVTRGPITVRTVDPKPAAKRRRQLRKDGDKSHVACSTELADCAAMGTTAMITAHVLADLPRLRRLLRCWLPVRACH